jgi:transcriptional regulator with XRE-family HTH domain
METTTSMGERIRAAREAAGLSQDQLAELTGMSKTTVSNWERGVMNPRVRELPDLRLHLKTSIDYLVCGDAPGTPARLYAAEPTETYQVSDAQSESAQRRNQLMAIFVQLTDAQQKAVLEVARTMNGVPGTRGAAPRTPGSRKGRTR